MATAIAQPTLDVDQPINLGGADFAAHKYEWYRWMLEEAPACAGKVSLVKVNLVFRYDDCRMVLTDERFMRNRNRALGKKSASTNPLPFPLPPTVKALASSMIQQDDPEHRRLRNLVNKAFTPRAVARLSGRVEDLSHELLDEIERDGRVDLLETYARQVPTRVISEMVGVDQANAENFAQGMSVLTKGFSGLRILRTMVWDLPKLAKFLRRLIADKRSQPGEDILTGLIAAEEEGDRLTEDELLAMVFLLIIGGYETTQHLITNGVRTLLEHPEAKERLKSQPELWDSAVEEIVRHRGPVQGTKLQYPCEDVEVHGYTLKRGVPVMPMLGAANHDPRVFDNPDEFNIERWPNRHLGFGFGMHFCLGAQLARMETKVALKNLFDRNPNLKLDVDPSELEIIAAPGWHRHAAFPVTLG